MHCPDTKIFKLEIRAWKPVVAGLLEKGEFIGEPSPATPNENDEPSVAFAEPFTVPDNCGTISK